MKRALFLSLLLLHLFTCVAAAEQQRPTVTVHVEDADIVYVVKLICSQARLNVFVGPEVAGTVSVDLDDVPFDEALREVLQPLGVDFRVLDDGETVVVASPESLCSIEANIMGCRRAAAPATPGCDRAAAPAIPGVPVGRRSVSAAGSVAEFRTESYSHFEENPFSIVLAHPLATFSADVDTASYSNLRRLLKEESWPPKGAVRIEEMLNYFQYDLPEPRSTLGITTELSACPWQPAHDLLRICVRARRPERQARPPCNLVFLLDVSGSMNAPDKLPLVKASIHALVDSLAEEDRVAIVVYAGSSGLALPSTPVGERSKITRALDELVPAGSTNGAEGIRLAYQVCREQFRQDGVNRVVLCTDGDFNVGVTSESELVDLIRVQRQSGICLTALGFGTGNLKDSTLEKLADCGDGNYAYIDSLEEARKVLVREGGSTLVTLARDVKLQVEFNPTRVQGYRLVGYENRVMRDEDFQDDAKDAGELGPGHTVTALFEVVPSGQPVQGPAAPTLRYQERRERRGPSSRELGFVKIRYREPASGLVRCQDQAIPSAVRQPTRDQQFAAAVAACGMLLRRSPHAGSADWQLVENLAAPSASRDMARTEFLELVRLCRTRETAAAPGPQSSR